MREILNEFEESISNAEYKDDVYEQRKEIGIIVEYYIQKKNPEIVQVLELDEGDGEILRNVLFKIFVIKSLFALKITIKPCFTSILYISSNILV